MVRAIYYNQLSEIAASDTVIIIVWEEFGH